MKKSLILLVILLIIALPSIPCAQDNREWTIAPRMNDYSKPMGSAGSITNPYVVRERYDGNLEIRTRQYDYNAPVFAPGQPANPYVVKPRY